MLMWTHGEVDFEDGRFTARFNGDPTVVARLKKIQRCHWRASSAVWVIDAHWPSVSRLIRIALDQRWKITAAAWNEKERVQVEGESLEYSIDMIHDNQGRARFRFMVGNDDELRDEVRSIPGAYWEDEYYSVPTDWDHCCPPFRAIVERDMRVTVSPAAVRLLEDEDVSHLYIRTLAPPSAVAAKRRELLRKPTPAAVDADVTSALEREPEHSDRVNDDELEELTEALATAKPTTRKPRVRARGTNPPATGEENAS
jgi:hypothetical protein